jgi:hypothetical protein
MLPEVGHVWAPRDVRASLRRTIVWKQYRPRAGLHDMPDRCRVGKEAMA